MYEIHVVVIIVHVGNIINIIIVIFESTDAFAREIRNRLAGGVFYDWKYVSWYKYCAYYYIIKFYIVIVCIDEKFIDRTPNNNIKSYAILQPSELVNTRGTYTYTVERAINFALK